MALCQLTAQWGALVTMHSPILDQYGNHYQGWGGNGINQSVKRSHKSEIIRNQEKDWGDLFPSHDVKLMRSACRTLYENNGVVKGAINLVADYSVGDAFDPIYKGTNTDWGKQASEWLEIWYSRCDVRGDTFDFKTTMNIDSVSLDRDGWGFCAKIKDETGYPQLQHVPAHRVGVRDPDSGVVEAGVYVGLRIVNGSILNEFGRVVAYRVLGSVEALDRDISADSLMSLIDARYYDQSSGIPSLSHGINDMKNMAKSSEYELMRQVIESQIAIIEHNEDGEFRPDEQKGVSDSGVAIKEMEGGQYVYMKANSGENLTTLSPSGNPSEQFINFHNRLTRATLIGMGLSSGIVVQPEGQGTADRADLAKADKAIAKRQSILKKHGMKKLIFALGCAIDRGDLPADPDWMKWAFTLPRKLSIDLGRDSKQQQSEYNSGILNLEDIKGNGRMEQHLRTRANEEALTIEIKAEVEQKGGVEIDIRRMRMLTPNDQPELAAVAPEGEEVKGEAEQTELDFLNLKSKFDAYGVAVRAGAITPEREDEAAFRKEAGLPPMSAAVLGAWVEDKGFRRPITLLSKTDEALTKQELSNE